MDELITLELTYKQLLELKTCMIWKTTSYSDRTVLDIILKRIKEIEEQMKDTKGDAK